MASASFIFLGFGAALLYLKLHPGPIRNKTAFFMAWIFFFATLFMVALFGVIEAANNGSPSNMHLARVWGDIVSWTLVAAGGISLYQALTPATGKPERNDRAEKSDEQPDRRSRRGRAESGSARDANDADVDTDMEDTRARAHTPGRGLRTPSRFGMDIDAERPDPALEAKVDDALDAEPELVESKEDELPLEPSEGSPAPAPAAPVPPLESEPIKVKTTAASISRSRNIAVERPKTERVRPRSEINPAIKKSGVGIPVTGGSSGSRTNIPVTGANEPVSVPKAPPAARSGRRPAASGIRPAALSGIAPPLKEKESVDTPSKDQYLDK